MLSKSYNIILYLRDGDKHSAFLYFLKYLKSKFEIFDVKTVREMSFFDGKVKTILIPYGFSEVQNIQEKVRFLEKNQKAFIIRYLNEYNLSENKSLQNFFKKRPIDLLIVNFEKDRYKRYYKERLQLNCNCLSYFDFKKSFVNEKKYDMPVYYGSFRLGRIEYFKKYFDDNDNIFFSTLTKNIVKFKKYGINFRNFIRPLSPFETGRSPLRLFKYSLYIEDKVTHDNYNYPANRFYECLSYDVVMFFDKNCKNTFDRYGIDISEFIVDGKEDLDYKIKHTNYVEALQKQKKWIEKVMQDREELEKIVNEKLSQHFI